MDEVRTGTYRAWDDYSFGLSGSDLGQSLVRRFSTQRSIRPDSVHMSSILFEDTMVPIIE